MSIDPLKITSNWSLLRSLAPDRFDAYVRSTDSDEIEALARYVWNIEVSKSLHSKLHLLEVTFRNQLHNALVMIHGPTWYDTPRLLKQQQHNQIIEAKSTLSRARKPSTPGRIVASLSFGFWTSLYGRDYDLTIGRLTVRSVFPYYSGRSHLQRSLIAPTLREIRLLRNRVSHFEPVAFDPELPRYHKEMTTLLRWMNPQMAELSDIEDDFRFVYGKTWTVYRPFLESVFG